jgi:RNA 3'-terminal phosphate cyclase
MFSIVGTLENKEAFGDTAKLFEAINQDEFKGKLEETLSHIQNLFDLSGNFPTDNSETNTTGTGINMPDAEKIQEHITGMLDGKLGQLAREIAEETAANLDIDFENANDMKDVFQKLMKNPTKLMGLVKNVGSKLDSKMKSGELKESELIAEASDMMNKMKNIPGMDNIQSMLSKMGMSGLGGGKVNTKAMESQLNNRMKLAKTKERIRAKAEANAIAKEKKERK